MKTLGVVYDMVETARERFPAGPERERATDEVLASLGMTRSGYNLALRTLVGEAVARELAVPEPGGLSYASPPLRRPGAAPGACAS